MPKARAWGGFELAFALIDPNAIGRFEIIAHINIRTPVAIEVAHHHRKAPIKRRQLQGLAVFIQECAASPGNGGEMAMTIVQIKRVRLAVFFMIESALSTRHGNIEVKS